MGTGGAPGLLNTGDAPGRLNTGDAPGRVGTGGAPASLFELAALNTPGDDVCDKVDVAAPTPNEAGYEDRNLPGAPEKATLFLDTPLLFELALLLARMLLFVIILLVASAPLVAPTFLVAS